MATRLVTQVIATCDGCGSEWEQVPGREVPRIDLLAMGLYDDGTGVPLSADLCWECRKPLQAAVETLAQVAVVSLPDGLASLRAGLPGRPKGSAKAEPKATGKGSAGNYKKGRVVCSRCEAEVDKGSWYPHLRAAHDLGYSDEELVQANRVVYRPVDGAAGLVDCGIDGCVALLTPAGPGRMAHWRNRHPAQFAVYQKQKGTSNGAESTSSPR